MTNHTCSKGTVVVEDGMQCWLYNVGFDVVVVALYTGLIPMELGQLTSLTHLDLSNNRLDGESKNHEAYIEFEVNLATHSQKCFSRPQETCARVSC